MRTTTNYIYFYIKFYNKPEHYTTLNSHYVLLQRYYIINYIIITHKSYIIIIWFNIRHCMLSYITLHASCFILSKLHWLSNGVLLPASLNYTLHAITCYITCITGNIWVLWLRSNICLAARRSGRGPTDNGFK